MSEKGNEVKPITFIVIYHRFHFHLHIVSYLYSIITHAVNKRIIYVRHQKNVIYILCNLNIRAALSRMVSN